MYRILSIEDDPEQEAAIAAHIERYSAEEGVELRLVWEQSAFDLNEAAAGYDLVLLDIELPGINGMDAARELRTTNTGTPIIFITNLSQYALKGYEVDALDFVVKPVGYYDFKLRLDKALRVLARSGRQSVGIATENGLRVVQASDIVYVDVRDHDLAYHLADGEVLGTRQSLTKAEEELAASSMVRISNSCIVNMARIVSISGSELTMAGGDTVWFSRSRRKAALATIARYLNGSL